MALDLSLPRKAIAGPSKPLFRPYADDEDETRETTTISEPFKRPLPPAIGAPSFGSDVASSPLFPAFYWPQRHPFGPIHGGAPAMLSALMPPLMPLWAAAAFGARRAHRPLCGRYVKSGPAASRHVLQALRRKVIQRQQMKYWSAMMRVQQMRRAPHSFGEEQPGGVPLKKTTSSPVGCGKKRAAAKHVRPQQDHSC